MPEPSINVEELLAPIPGDHPAGEPVPFAIRNDLEEKRKEIDPDAFDANDPARPTEAKLADWPGIVEVAAETLRSKSKDLLVAARLTEALTKTHGFTGLADGLAAMKGILDQCWERCYPDIADGDLEVRAGPFNWLSDANRGARFPHAVRSVKLVRGPDGVFGWVEWRSLQDGKGGSKEVFDRVVSATTRDVCQANFDELSRCVREFTSLVDLLAAKFGPEAPPLVDLRSAIADCHTLAKMILERKGPAEADAAPAEGESGSGTAASGGRGGAMSSRTEIYRRLQEAADALERLEPHSPIPYLLRRAVELGAMPFPQLIRSLLADGGNLDSITKEFGIKEPEA
jgi:type VI secretion system protein ImpA